jgi:uncharacterized membrane protein YphA (DoxX/SURF4 family)
MQHSFKWQQVCAWLLRVGLAAAFLSAVADRFGLWGQPGSRGVSWGDMAHFYDYTAEVNAFLPSTLIPAVAWLATIAEIGLGFALLSGVCRRPVALATGVLLTLFALAMSISLGVHSALAYSVPTAAAAALLLATTDRPPVQGLLRTDNASLSPEGGATATASPPGMSAGTDSGRAIKCRLLNHRA